VKCADLAALQLPFQQAQGCAAGAVTARIRIDKQLGQEAVAATEFKIEAVGDHRVADRDEVLLDQPDLAEGRVGKEPCGRGHEHPVVDLDVLERVECACAGDHDGEVGGGRGATSHNDMNPSNLVFDGERLLLLDWDMAGPNDPFYDLAAVAMFLRMDDPTASALIAAYDAAPPAALPDGFVYARRLVAALCATIFLHLARHAGHAGGDIPADRAPTLARRPRPHWHRRARPEHRRGRVGVRARAGPHDHGSRRAEPDRRRVCLRARRWRPTGSPRRCS